MVLYTIRISKLMNAEAGMFGWSIAPRGLSSSAVPPSAELALTGEVRLVEGLQVVLGEVRVREATSTGAASICRLSEGSVRNGQNRLLVEAKSSARRALLVGRSKLLKRRHEQRQGLTRVVHVLCDFSKHAQRGGLRRGEEVIAELVERRHFGKRVDKAFGEFEDLAYPLATRLLSVLVLAHQPEEVALWVVRERRDVLVRLPYSVARCGDGLCERPHVRGRLVIVDIARAWGKRWPGRPVGRDERGTAVGVRLSLCVVIFGCEESRGFSARVTNVLPPKSIIGSNSERATDGFEVTLLREERNVDLLIISINLVEEGFQVGEHPLVRVSSSCGGSREHSAKKRCGYVCWRLTIPDTPREKFGRLLTEGLATVHEPLSQYRDLVYAIV